jgi:hypothetical protein
VLKKKGTPAVLRMSKTEGTSKIEETPGKERMSTTAGSQQQQKRQQ